MKKKKPDEGKKGNTMGRREAITTTAASLAALSVPGFRSGPISNQQPQTDSSNPAAIYSITDETSRQFTTFNPKTKEKAYPIQPGERKNLVKYRGAGIITRLWMTVSGWFWMHWEPDTYTDPTILKKLILRIYWDGNDYPSVEAPIGDFFGIGQCEYKQYLSKYMGMSSGGFYNYFPMPFEKGVRIEVENLHDKVVPYVFLNANYKMLDTLPSEAGRFHCLYNAGTNTGTEPTHILKARGKGHYVGCCLSMQGKEKNYLSFLEAPEYFYIDTEDHSEATIVGTGLEDYFNGGWYFREGEFDGPYHGVPIKDALRSMVSMYRFHKDDAIHFNESIEMAFITPKPSGLPFKFSSTAHWYQKQAGRLAYQLPDKDQLVDWYRLRDKDHQSIP